MASSRGGPGALGSANCAKALCDATSAPSCGRISRVAHKLALEQLDRLNASAGSPAKPGHGSLGAAEDEDGSWPGFDGLDDAGGTSPAGAEDRGLIAEQEESNTSAQVIAPALYMHRTMCRHQGMRLHHH